MRVNKSELAQILGISMPTLSAYLARFGDAFPVIERGGRGRDWLFDHGAVAAFLDARKAETAQADGERQAAIRQLGLFGSNGGPPLDEPAPLKPTEMLALAKVRKLRREEEYEAGRLVKAADVIENNEDDVADVGAKHSGHLYGVSLTR